MFAGFQRNYRLVNSVNIHYRTGGKGPPLLLLHGHPQTHVMWHRVAGQLAKRFTVVATDLRGYGDSDKPPASENSHLYSKRVMAQDQVELMDSLGFTRFDILAHDRGARVAHRLALDHPGAVKRMILLDIAPTLCMYEQTTEQFARAYWHWFFLIRPAPLPETLITADPEIYLRQMLYRLSAGENPFTAEAFNEYLRCLSLPGAATGTCEDYRASAGIDLEHDRHDIASGNRVACPLLVLWGTQGVIEKCFNPLEEWKKVALNVEGAGLPSGHFIPEEVPEILLEYAWNFFDQTGIYAPHQ